ncbi:class I SAM-dependent methyltransferase [Chloroflexota bacterium]
MKLEFLELMRCPYCYTDFSLGEVYQMKNGELINGCVKCECGEFSVLEGILNLRRSPLSAHVNTCIKDGRTGETSELMLEKYSESARRVADVLESKGMAGRMLRQILLSLIRNKSRRNFRRYADMGLPFCELLGTDPSAIYLKNRFSADSFWSVYPFIPLLKQKRERILDLACGTGHASFVLSSYIKPAQVVCADHVFGYLYLAKKYFAPEATFICLDANYPLPFKEGIFSSVFMMDAFHYVQSRASLAREMERILFPQGLLVLLHLHNSLGHNLAAGQPLSPSTWLGLFQQLPVKALPEKEVVEDFIAEQKLDLSKQYAEQELNSANAISLMGTKDKSLLQSYPQAGSDFIENKDNLIINPIYRIEQKPGQLILRRKFLGESFEQEYPLTMEYLPEEHVLSGKLMEAVKGRTVDVTSGGFSGEDLSLVEDLMKKFILINAPTNYC